MKKFAVYNGIDVIGKYDRLFRNKNIGLITNPTGVDRNLNSTIDIVNSKYKLKALFSPEHGIRGDKQAGAKVDTYVDKKTKLTVYSLYGSTEHITDEMLAGIDMMVMDIQDVGSRYYTYIATMGRAMEDCARYGIPFVVLDRMNPLGGDVIDGNILDMAFRSSVGFYPIPVRTGLTLGELAYLINKEFSIGCNLDVVLIEGWNRCQYFDETDLPWINPSPNMPQIETAIVYNASCLLEGTNVSEGRGTTRPFEWIGAPWIDPDELADAMNGRKLDGVTFRPIYFTPTFSKYQGELCGGVQIHVNDRRSFKPFETGISLVYAIMDLYYDKFTFIPPYKEGGHYFIDHLAGTDQVRLRQKDYNTIIDNFSHDLAKFAETKVKYHLY